jgi:hypothetical protein
MSVDVETTVPPTKRAPNWIPVPHTADRAKCRGCRAVVYWVNTVRGRRMPVDCAVPDGVAPVRSPAQDGRGVAHFAMCPAAGEFRRKHPT